MKRNDKRGYRNVYPLLRVICGVKYGICGKKYGLTKGGADLGKLGGLLKKWMTKNEKTKPSLGNRAYQEVDSIGSNILEDQMRILSIAEKITLKEDMQ